MPPADDPALICPKTRFQTDPRPPRVKLYAQLCLIRRFEERVLELIAAGEIAGTTHCYIGQEADAVGVIDHLEAGDVVFSNHRGHGHFLAWSDDPGRLMAELMGRSGGVCGGRGGSQHLLWGNFYSNGVQGGIVPNATGMAMAEKIRGTGRIAVVFLGDGTLGQGVVYESMNMAALWGAPILFVVENNFWAQTTALRDAMAGDLVARATAFGIEAGEVASTDAEGLLTHFESIVDKVRAARRPHFEVIHTYRLAAHSRGDDVRPPAEVDARRAGDPLRLVRRRLDPDVAAAIEETACARVEAAIDDARRQPWPEVRS